MFPQAPTVSVSLREGAADSRQALTDLLQRSPQVSARVVRSVPVDDAGGGYRVQIQVNQQTAQLITRQPLPEGSQIQLSVDSSGKLTATVTTQSTGAAQPAATTTQPAATTPLPAQVLQAVSSTALKLATGESIEATVLRSTPAPAGTATPATGATSTAPASQPAATANPVAYARPLPAQPATVAGSSPTTSSPPANPASAAPPPPTGSGGAQTVSVNAPQPQPTMTSGPPPPASQSAGTPGAGTAVQVTQTAATMQPSAPAPAVNTVSTPPPSGSAPAVAAGAGTTAAIPASASASPPGAASPAVTSATQPTAQPTAAPPPPASQPAGTPGTGTTGQVTQTATTTQPSAPAPPVSTVSSPPPFGPAPAVAAGAGTTAAIPASASAPPPGAASPTVTSATQQTAQPTTAPVAANAPPATAGAQTGPGAVPNPASAQQPGMVQTQQPIPAGAAHIPAAAPATSSTPSGTTAAVSTNTAAPAASSMPPQSTTQFDLQLVTRNGQSVQLRGALPLPPDTTVRLTAAGTDRFLAEPTAAPKPQPPLREQPSVQEALRTALPLQQPVGEALSQLQTATASAASTQPAQLPNLVRSMLQLFGLRPGAPEAPTTVKTNVELGGLQTEGNLATSGRGDGRDMKTLLHQLRQQAAELPMEQRARFERLIDTIQARVTSNQLSSLQQWKDQPDGSFERVIQLDIPVLQQNRVDNVELRISEEGGRQADGSLQSLWRVRLHFELDASGTVDAELKLTSEEDIHVRFWCSNRLTFQQVRNQLNAFDEQLRSRGFMETELDCYHGTAPHQKTETIQKRLVDIHT